MRKKTIHTAHATIEPAREEKSERKRIAEFTAVAGGAPLERDALRQRLLSMILKSESERRQPMEARRT